jgi:acetyl esterase
MIALLLAGCANRGENTTMSWFSTWPETGEGSLDPKVKAGLAAQGPVPDYRSQPLSEVRENFNRMAARLPKPDEPVAGVEDRTLEGGLRLRLYRPEGKGPFPLLLYFHGGGWVIGDLESHDHVCRALSRRAALLVISVDYRLSPETPFPGPLDDCAAALVWAADHAAEFGGDARRMAVGGDSAGANLAAGLALRVRDQGGPRIGFQLLIYPVTDRNFETVSYREFASGYGLTRNNMQWFWDCYLPTGGALPPEAAPLRARDLRGLPPAFVVTAEFDVLRDEGEAYARRLHKEGVAVRGIRFLGMNHGFIRMGAVYRQADRALTELAAALRRAFSE